MLGYMTKKQAVEFGMTHHGSYYGIPVWMAPDHPDFWCCAKWRPFEVLMALFMEIEGFIRSTMFPGRDPAFQFTIGDPIVKKVEYIETWPLEE